MQGDGVWRVEALQAERWADFVDLFGANGACAGCWCMYWKLPAGQYRRQCADHGAANRAAMQARVAAGATPGLLAYDGRQAIGWIALEPRADYPRLGASRILAPLDERPVWSLSCFFVRRGWRGRGVSTALLKAAIGYARSRGAACLEGYPQDPLKPMANAFAWTGIAAVFRRAGFVECARRSPKRPIMRLEL